MSWVRFFHEVDRNHLSSVGGKGANLGELVQAGFSVPEGFCVTTVSYQAFLEQSEEMGRFFLELEKKNAASRICQLGEEIREHLQTLPIPESIEESVRTAWNQIDPDAFYAVRSSATAEDLPTASFAGQQDTYLNQKGIDQLLQAIRRCWASLFTERAIQYRIKNGFEHRHVQLAVVVQKMIFPQVSGILFTADPLTGHRDTVSIDASYGLGEALVSGLVSADLYCVREGKIQQKQLGEKKQAIYANPQGGTLTVDVPPDKQQNQALTDEQIQSLAALGKRIEAHFGQPQDIEWCLQDEQWFIVQSRPITSLYPTPQFQDDRLHVLLSFGHKQMMTDPMSPFGLSVIRKLGSVGNKSWEGIYHNVGNRLYFDVTDFLYFPSIRKKLIGVYNEEDHRTGTALSQAIEKEAFQREAKPDPAIKRWLWRFSLRWGVPILGQMLRYLLIADPEQQIAKFKRRFQQDLSALNKAMQKLQGMERVAYIKKHLSNMLLMPTFLPSVFSILTGVMARNWISQFTKQWLGDDAEINSLVGKLNLSLPGNITSEMGLAIGDIADVIRRYPQVLGYLRQADDDRFYEDLDSCAGGEVVCQELNAFMEKYGMRGPSEIDIARPRWREVPTGLVSPILSHIRSVKPGEHRQRFAIGEEEAQKAEHELLQRVKRTFAGGLKSKWLKRLIRCFRYYFGYREYPKYMIIQLFWSYKQALLTEGERLVEQQVLANSEDLFYLSLSEFKQLVAGQRIGDVQTLVAARKEEMAHHAKLVPPRVLTSEGEALNGEYSGREAPDGSLLGVPVSTGIVEGRARIVHRPEEAELHTGDILVAPFTDPGWTPLFQSASGLVMEVGGMMTHGSVVAREYGIPAVVGVDQATNRIRDGQLIRVNGVEGFVEILDEEQDE